MCIIRHWPTAAAACFTRSSRGRSERPSFSVPTAMAPEDTRMTSWPRPWRSARVRARRSMLLKSKLPESWVRVEVPTFTTTRSFFSSILLSSRPMGVIFSSIARRSQKEKPKERRKPAVPAGPPVFHYAFLSAFASSRFRPDRKRT